MSANTAEEQSDNSPADVVLLVHGIRTRGAWAEMVAHVIRERLGLRTQPIRYGYFDVFRFLLPFLGRAAPARRIVREWRDIRTANPSAQISVIAHSFGTYSTIKALEEPDVQFKRIIFCGSIVPEDFRASIHRAQLGKDPILNDCGTHDLWPVIASSVTWGFGASGTFGFGTHGIRDRFNKFSHSSYFERGFVERFWIPFLRNGQILGTEWEIERHSPPYWQSLLAWFPFKSGLAVLALLGGWAAFSGFGLSTPPSITMNNPIFVGHWMGIKHVFARIDLVAGSDADTDFVVTRGHLVSPEGKSTDLKLEGITDCEGSRPNMLTVRVESDRKKSCDFPFIGETFALSDLYQRLSASVAAAGLTNDPPFPVKNRVPEPLLKEITDTAAGNFSWSPGTWRFEVEFSAAGMVERRTYAFDLLQPQVTRMRNQIDYYVTGLGLFNNWRYLSPDGQQSLQPVTVRPAQK